MKNYFLISQLKQMLWVLKKNCPNETVLLGTPKHMFKWTDKKMITILR